MRLRLQFKLQLAEVRGRCCHAPSSAGCGLITTNALVHRFVSDRIYPIMGRAVQVVTCTIVLIIPHKPVQLAVDEGLPRHDLLNVLDARVVRR